MRVGSSLELKRREKEKTKGKKAVQLQDLYTERSQSRTLSEWNQAEAETDAQHLEKVHPD